MSNSSKVPEKKKKRNEERVTNQTNGKGGREFGDIELMEDHSISRSFHNLTCRQFQVFYLAY